MDLSTIKSVSPNRNTFKKIMALLFSLAVIADSFVVITNANKAAKDTVDVLRVSDSGGIPAHTVLTEKQLQKYAIIRKEYTDDMVLAEHMDEAVGKFSKYYLRGNGVLYKDQLAAEVPKKNEWLYKLDDKQEVLTLPYNFLEAGGDILMPGDRVRIRVSYEVDKPAASNPNDIYSVSQGKTTKTEVLFDSIVVKDMLNGNSHSIYEVYKEVLKLSEDKRQTVMKSEDFLKNIQPRALLLEGSSDQINYYAKFKSMENKSLLITILSRSDSQAIVDQLPTLQNEVESWIDKQNGN
ncbi:flagellar biosynthesis protein FlgA [Paenibacillus humicus]|uniref:flagellar biosynthesis protein FlgA n=1 Tax=Paenibacillus humicus TaxID=412861 RepID=UPI000FDAA1BA|nr:flagellar biosynthesis protein FlgA [Paenibacillus humicus]